MKVAIIGIGNVGLPLTAVAARYHKMIGIDINKEWIGKLRRNEKITEPHVNNLLAKYPFEKTWDFSKVSDCYLVIILVGSQKEEYSEVLVKKVIKSLKPYLTSKRQVLSIVSTMKPGTMDKKIVPYLKRLGILEKIKGVCYNPVFVALGSAVKYFNNPGYILIGESSRETGAVVDSFWRSIVPKDTRFYHNDFSNIEVFKFALNLVLINKISLLNTLTEYCEAYGADIDFISTALKADPRIAGPKMFRGGLGFGGTCFPVDARSFSSSQKAAKLDNVFTDAIMKVNEHQIERTVELIESLKKKKVTVLGVTYKPNVKLVTESQALEIANRLSKKYQVMVYDPEGIPEARKVLRQRVRYAKDLMTAVKYGDVVLIAVDWNIFKMLGSTSFRPNQIVIDCWRILKGYNLKCKYIPFGKR